MGLPVGQARKGIGARMNLSAPPHYRARNDPSHCPIILVELLAYLGRRKLRRRDISGSSARFSADRVSGVAGNSPASGLPHDGPAAVMHEVGPCLGRLYIRIVRAQPRVLVE